MSSETPEQTDVEDVEQRLAVIRLRHGGALRALIEGDVEDEDLVDLVEKGVPWLLQRIEHLESLEQVALAQEISGQAKAPDGTNGMAEVLEGVTDQEIRDDVMDLATRLTVRHSIYLEDPSGPIRAPRALLGGAILQHGQVEGLAVHLADLGYFLD